MFIQTTSCVILYYIIEAVCFVYVYFASLIVTVVTVFKDVEEVSLSEACSARVNDK